MNLLRKIFVLSLFFSIIQLLPSFSQTSYTTDDADFWIAGENVDDNLGRDVVSGDLNGDGYDDLAVSASGASPNERTGAGIVYVFFGSHTFLNKNNVDLSIAEADVKILGALADDELGMSLGVGNIMNNGRKSLLIGAPYRSASNGAVFVITFPSDFYGPQILDLASPTGSQSIVTIIGNSGDYIGRAVGAGDMNGDGFDEIMIGGHYFFTNGVGYVVKNSGSYTNEQTINLSSSSNYHWKMTAAESLDLLGDSVLGADINGDSKADFIIGAAFAGSIAGNDSTGRVYVMFGTSSLPTGVTVGANSATLIIRGRLDTSDSNPTSADYDNFGGALASGDVNADGIKDLIIGASDDEIDRDGAEAIGMTYVVYGRASFPSLINLSPAIKGGASPADIAIIGATNVAGRIGDSVASGRINLDSIDDILTEAPSVGVNSEGRVFIIYGRYYFPPQFTVNLLNNEEDIVINGNIDNFSSVESITTGDANNDGISEIYWGGPFLSQDIESELSQDIRGWCGKAFIFQLMHLTNVKSNWDFYE